MGRVLLCALVATATLTLVLLPFSLRPPATARTSLHEPRRGAGTTAPLKGPAWSPCADASAYWPSFPPSDGALAHNATLGSGPGVGAKLGAASRCLLLMHIPKTAGNGWIEAFYRGELDASGDELLAEWRAGVGRTWRYYAHDPRGKPVTLQEALDTTARWAERIASRTSIWVRADRPRLPSAPPRRLRTVHAFGELPRRPTDRILHSSATSTTACTTPWPGGI